ncbi:MAG: riboflavin synthase [Gammaproteobacteria bacterium]|nr:riboflavin synthase [Gammaproteobacteria bacterium]
MFTGIIASIGTITHIEHKGGDCRLTISTGKLPLADVQLGDSIAVNGVCLTAIELGKQHFCADVSNETLSRTTLNTAVIGTPVNLELALTPSTRLGGHIVSGHVDGLGELVKQKPDARSIRMTFKAPSNLAKYITAKGSITINGISLTVNTVNGAQFSVNIVPHTLHETTLSEIKVGDKVNLEVDLLARYLERLLLGDKAAMPQSNISEELLIKCGFIN